MLINSSWVGGSAEAAAEHEAGVAGADLGREAEHGVRGGGRRRQGGNRGRVQ